MDYLFENFSPERFQEFCHCIINSEFPESQAFPVGQRDGGRDTIAYESIGSIRNFIIFQVKFVREPNKIVDPHKWLVDIIKEESKKVANLIPKGATKYFLLTNVKGTAYLDKGSIDIVDDILRSNIPIPSICWWRDDLSRKFESNHSLKWSFPEIINGQDILNSIVFNQLHEARNKRESIITAYLVDQYELDSEVKFKQIELQNNLLDLFVDVPIRLKEYLPMKGGIKQFKVLDELNQTKKPFRSRDEYDEDDYTSAAEFLLNKSDKLLLNRILLEGGPGQGKSTITQYICQIHRIRLLNRISELNIVENHIKSSPLKLPFKIDLRDLATWLSKKNPYSSVINEEYFNSNWHKSLESFLMAHIYFHSKIESFEVIDLISVCKISSVLFVFDGFDEIADIKIRDEVIDQINKGLNRIEENSKALQVIITSRPAAFTSSKKFSPEIYPHFELSNVNAKITKQYVEKWVKSRRLKDREASEIKRIVSEKLKLPHLRDLAKSPMQLAILLSLINTRGESLPNKRTALYESYVELFFDREAEKNLTIRDKRDLIISIHEYLAWVLHSEAEMFNNNGRIEVGKLIEKLKYFLEKEGHPTIIADELFTVVKERVCALASRVQGTFEFEVQPLREYFCAKHLYNTSPYSPAGREKRGTKPDRFDALARNYYWQNVLRFFAGCFDRGELPMLIMKLRELENDKFYKYTNYPRFITSQLLSDWVFSQYPKLMTEVLSIILNGINIGAIYNQYQLSFKQEILVLPKGSGREFIAKESFNELKKFPSFDYALELIGIINNNRNDVIETLLSHAKHLGAEELNTWLTYGLHLGVYHKMDKNDLFSLFFGKENRLDEPFRILINTERTDVIEYDIKYKKMFLELTLESKVFPIYSDKFESSIVSFASFFNLTKISWIINDSSYRNNISFLSLVFEKHNHPVSDRFTDSFNIDDIRIKDEVDESIVKFLKLSEEIVLEKLPRWRNSIQLWDELVENGRNVFGDRWVFKRIANIAAGIKSSEEKFSEHSNLSDSSVSLCKRVRHARLKSGILSYWIEQLNKADDLVFVLLILFTWGTSKTIQHILDLVIQKLNSLDSNDQETLLKSLTQFGLYPKFSKVQQEEIISTLKTESVPDILKFCLSLRFPDLKSWEFFESFLQNYNGNISEILGYKYDMLIKSFFAEPSKQKIQLVMNTYKKLPINNRRISHRSQYQVSALKELDYELSKYIMQNCKHIPKIIVSIAEYVCRKIADINNKSVGKIAIEEVWFEDK